jgi:hypothetical protein
MYPKSQGYYENSKLFYRDLLKELKLYLPESSRVD